MVVIILASVYVHMCVYLVPTLIGSTLSPKVLHNSASLNLQQTFHRLTYYSMIFSNYKNLEPYGNGQGYKLLCLLLDITSANVVFYGIPQYVQCTHH